MPTETLFPAILATAAHDNGTFEVFKQTASILALAMVVGFIGAKLKQPLIVSFIAVGVLAGPFALDLVVDKHSLELFAEIGIAVLLFIVGLKLDLKLIRTMGPVALATGLGQVIFTSLGGFLIALALGLAVTPAIYVAVALTFSSTIIIVKLLSDKREIDALHGRIAIGFLIVQDICVVIAMIALTAYGAGEAEGVELLSEFAIVALKGIAFLAGIVLLMRFGLPQLLQQLARTPELLVLFAISWAVGLATLGEVLGFSQEVGAFLAGVALASTQYRDAIGTRLISLRDFLLLFFFIHLGATLQLDLLGDAIVPAIVFSVFVLVGNPIIVLIIMGLMGYRKRTAFLAGLTVAQISEFSLILIGLGATLGHVDDATVGLVTLVGLITIGTSTYMILYSAYLYRWLAPLLSVFERKIPYREAETPEEAEKAKAAIPRVDALVFGLGNYGGSIVRGLLQRGKNVVGVDFDPQALRYWREQGLTVFYGDVEDPDLLEHLPIRRARWVLVATPDPEVTTRLVSLLRHAKFDGKLALAARTQPDASRYESLGVDRVLRPFADAAEQAVDALDAALHILPEQDIWPTSLREVRLPTGSKWAGKPIGTLPLRQETGTSILAVSRGGRTIFDPEADFELFPGDHIVLLGEPDKLNKAAEILHYRDVAGEQGEGPHFSIEPIEMPAVSGFAHKTLGELHVRREFGVTVIGIERGEQKLRTLSAETTVEPQDRLIVAGAPEAVARLREQVQRP